MAVYFFYGEEDYNIEAEIHKLKSSLDKNYIDMSYRVYDNPSFPDLISAIRTQPMMFGKMLIVIKCYNYFFKVDNKEIKFDDRELDEISLALDNNNNNVDIVFVAELPRDEGKKLDSRRKLFKILSKYNAKEFNVIPTYKTAELEAWVKKQVQAKKLKITQDGLTAIISQIGNNLRQIDKELDKLQVALYPDNLINAQAVKENCISNEDMFAFAEYLMTGQKNKIHLEYRRLLDKKHYLEIVSALQTMLRQWITIKARTTSHSPEELAKMTGMHEYRVKLTIQKLKKADLKELVRLKENITEAEYRIKAGLVPEPESEIENAFFR